jgi:acyl carrier protein
MSETSDSESIESLVNSYIREIVNKPDFSLKNDTFLLESGILDSLSLLKLVVFLEKRFAVVVSEEELVPENFKTIDSICNYIRSKRPT